MPLHWPSSGLEDAAVRLLRKPLRRIMDVHDDEVGLVLQAFCGFYFLLAAYFLCLPLRDEAGISLGTGTLPGLFLASLAVTLVAAPAASSMLAHPRLPKARALLLLYRFFAASLLGFLALYLAVPAADAADLRKRYSLTKVKDVSLAFFAVRSLYFVWIALLNLFATSAMWVRLADVMAPPAAKRLFGFVGAGATLGQLSGSLLASAMASSGPAMELAGRCAAQIGSVREPGGSLRMVAPSSGSDAVAPVDSPAKPLLAAAQPASAISPRSAPAAAVLTPPSSISPLPARLRTSSPSRAVEEGRARRSSTSQSPASGRGSVELFAGARLVAASPYLLHVCLFLLLNAAVSSFFYFEKAAILSAKVESAVARRRLIANINSLSAVATFSFQLTVTGRVLEHLGVVAALCATPLAALAGMAAIALSPSPAVVTIAEASRKVVNYVLTRPGREVLFTVVTREEKYKAKVLIDTLVQRMGDALAAGVYHILGSKLAMGPSGVAASAIPVCLTWLAVAVALGCQQRILAAAQHSGVAP